MSTRFFLLGSFRLELTSAHGHPTGLPRLRKARGLLAYLLLGAGHDHSRDALANLFWGEFPEERARDNLSTALSAIRPVLAASGVSLHADRYSVGLDLGPAWLDVAELKAGLAATTDPDRQIAALELYKGDLLADWLDEWIIIDREQLRRQVLDVGTALLQRFVVRREWAAGEALAERLISHDPVDGRIHDLLLSLLLGSGQREKARRTYQHYVMLLKTQLDAEPDESIQLTYQQALQEAGTYFDETGRQEETAFPVAEAATAPRIRLVGRATEQEFLRAAQTALRQGHGKLILIEGPNGIGKTRLVEESLLLARGLHIARGQGCELSQDSAFSMLLRPLGSWLLEDLAPPQVLSRLSLPVVSLLAQLLPSLAARIPGLTAPPQLPAAEARTQLVQATVAALRAAGRAPGAPAILFLDDLHYADTQTLLVLNEISAQLAATPLLIIAAYCADEVPPGSPLSLFIRDLDQRGLHPLRLQPLSLVELQGVIEPRQADGDLSRWLWEHSQGVPLLLIELLRGLHDAGVAAYDPLLGDWHLVGALPAVDTTFAYTVEAAIQQRFVRLSPAARTLVQVAAVLGHEASFELLAATAGIDDETALLGLEQALQRAFLWQRDEDSYLIEHNLTRDFVYNSIFPARRRHLHRRAASALEDQASRRPEPAVLAEIARHYGNAGVKSKQYEYLHKAATEARAAQNYEAAIAYYHHLLSLLADDQAEARLRVYQPLAEVLRRHNDYSKAKEVYDTMRNEAEFSGDLLMHARAWNGLARIESYLGDSATALRCAQHAEKLARSAGPAARAELALAFASQGWILYRNSQAQDAASLARQVLVLARDAADSAVVLSCLNLLGSIEESTGRYQEAGSYYEQALALAQEGDDHAAATRALTKLAENSYRCADYAAARDRFRAALHLARKVSNMAAEAQALIGLGASRLQLGDEQTAEIDMRRAIEINDRAETALAVPPAYITFAGAFLSRDNTV